MLRILKVIGGNLQQGSSTVRLPGSVPTPEGFRGPVSMDASRCLACGMCSYVCVSDAIAGAEEEGGYTWHYEPGRCAFCARCVERCPGKALTMDRQPLPAYGRPGELGKVVHVRFAPCPDCGQPARPATLELVRHAFAHPGQETLELVRLCERCRRKRLQRRLFAAEQADGKGSKR